MISHLIVYDAVLSLIGALRWFCSMVFAYPVSVHESREAAMYVRLLMRVSL